MIENVSVGEPRLNAYLAKSGGKRLAEDKSSWLNAAPHGRGNRVLISLQLAPENVSAFDCAIVTDSSN
jgi:hypothetical protein